MEKYAWRQSSLQVTLPDIRRNYWVFREVCLHGRQMRMQFLRSGDEAITITKRGKENGIFIHIWCFPDTNW